MAHIILTGATGAAGAAILQYALNSPQISRISILSRRPVALAANQPKATVIVHDNFRQYDQSVLDQLKGATACVWAQGISSRGMSQEAYEEITIDYPLVAAKAFASLGSDATGEDKGNMTFVYISGAGAELDEKKASMMFGRVKGRAEQSLLDLQTELPTLKVYNLRPAMINPEGNYLAERRVSIQDWLSTGFGALFERSWKKYVIPTDGLAKACIGLALGDGAPIAAGDGVEAGGRVLRNDAIRVVAGLPL